MICMVQILDAVFQLYFCFYKKFTNKLLIPKFAYFNFKLKQTTIFVLLLFYFRFEMYIPKC